MKTSRCRFKGASVLLALSQLIFAVGEVIDMSAVKNGAMIRNPLLCHSKLYNMDLTIGKSHPTPGKCQKMKCSRSFTIEHYSCGSVVATKNGIPCDMVEDKTKEYPKCCPKPACPPGPGKMEAKGVL